MLATAFCFYCFLHLICEHMRVLTPLLFIPLWIQLHHFPIHYISAPHWVNKFFWHAYPTSPHCSFGFPPPRAVPVNRACQECAQCPTDGCSAQQGLSSSPLCSWSARGSPLLTFSKHRLLRLHWQIFFSNLSSSMGATWNGSTWGPSW